MTHTSTEQPEALLPCPFCGGDDLQVNTYGVQPDNIYQGMVSCNACEFEGPSSLSLPEPDGAWSPDREDASVYAVRAWNRRQPVARTPLSDSKLSYIGAKHFKNHIPSAWYQAARDLESEHGITQEKQHGK